MVRTARARTAGDSLQAAEIRREAACGLYEDILGGRIQPGLDRAGLPDREFGLGNRAEEAVRHILSECGVTSRELGVAIKHLRALHLLGVLNEKMELHQSLLQSSAIRDPAPGYTQDVIKVVRQ
ncbi:hypothetical protein PR003_g6417 [Phytophthora rubi]|uniref:Uncharacterized protein n=1 Tax=Phytophthora rubi TaxID=129364 RepID=A0A6A3N8X6_9STRA|nr:hypothetical protein PR001_g7332 [Phytophthora rubi]KAE9039865.1 hypothetical protein PR002_g5243 [Phytophthora rubi]KAE9348428.1 hypothetical protein PR003_g6417 [Phytophthora rubi]